MSLQAALNRHWRSRHKHVPISGRTLVCRTLSPTILQEHCISVVYSDELLNQCTLYWLFLLFALLSIPFSTFPGIVFHIFLAHSNPYVSICFWGNQIQTDTKGYEVYQD